MTTEFPLDRCTADVIGILQEVNRAVGYQRNPVTVSEEEKESIDFFLDPTNVLFFTTPNSTAIKSQNVEMLCAGEVPFNALINGDITHTYLADGELALAATFANKFKTIVVGAVDRSTGIGLVLQQNWVDPNDIKDHVTATENGEPVTWPIKQIVPSYIDPTSPAARLSKGRLMNLLQDCKKYLIGRVAGVNLELREE